MAESKEPAEPMLLSVPQTMEQLNLSRTVLYELIRSGRLMSVTVGRKRLIPSGEIRSYVARLVAEAVARRGDAA